MKFMKSQNPRHTKSSHEITLSTVSLDEASYYETYETYENHETFKITKLMKPWNIDTMTPTKI